MGKLYRGGRIVALDSAWAKIDFGGQGVYKPDYDEFDDPSALRVGMIVDVMYDEQAGVSEWIKVHDMADEPSAGEVASLDDYRKAAEIMSGPSLSSDPEEDKRKAEAIEEARKRVESAKSPEELEAILAEEVERWTHGPQMHLLSRVMLDAMRSKRGL